MSPFKPVTSLLPELRPLSRRSALGLLGGTAVLACSGTAQNGSAGAAGSAGTGANSAGSANSAAGESGGGIGGGGGGTDATSGSGGTATSGAGGAENAASAGEGGAASASGCQLFSGWAVGGTQCMTGVGNYPNPFSAGGSSCPTSPDATIGPCHTTSPDRVDVSNGLAGIPLRMALRVVDNQCQPLSDAVVEIWHTNYKGGYSGDINQMCNLEAADKSKDFFRGYQVSDSDGIVYFNSCFPGWYRGRAIHVHVRILTTAYAAADNAPAASITQLLWADDFVDTIFTDVPLYAAFGKPDTHLSNDNVVSNTADKSVFLFDIQKMDDGTMLCSKTLVVG